MLSKPVRRVLEVLLTAVGSVVAVAVAGGAAWAVPGALIGLLCAFGAEWGASIRARLRRLTQAERELHRLRERERLLQEQAQLAERRAAVSEAWTEAFGGAQSETIRTGRIVPLPAILARAEVTLKSRGLDVPVAAPKTNPPLPPV
jgi:hypothetical protein